MFPKSKKRLIRTKVNKISYEQALTDTLHALFKNNLQERQALARYVNVCDRTVRNWLHERTKPSGYDLILLMQYSQTMLNVVLGLILGEETANEIITCMKIKDMYTNHSS